jgi:hypothetical protein
MGAYGVVQGNRNFWTFVHDYVDNSALHSSHRDWITTASMWNLKIPHLRTQGTTLTYQIANEPFGGDSTALKVPMQAITERTTANRAPEIP